MLGELEVEGGRPTGVAVEVDPPAEPLDDRLADAEAEPGASLLAARGGVGLGELLEDPAAELRRDPRAAVADGHTDGALAALGGHQDRLARRRVLRRIR